VALRFYLTEVHELGAELSMSTMLGRSRRRCRSWPSAHPTTACTAQDEPYRRALIGVYARLARRCTKLTGAEALRHAVAPQDPYADADEFGADLG
jgi:phosphoenolpyruvate carboxylase